MRQTDMQDIDAKEFAARLEEFGATVVFVNTAGIIASYETELPFHFQSEYLTGDSLFSVIEECHKKGIRVIARTDFSKVRRSLYEQHPEWAFRTDEGTIVDYNGDIHACLNGEYQQKHMLEIIAETITKLPIDAVFCNMGGFQTRDYSYNNYSICHCDNCKKRFQKMYGLSLPKTSSYDDPVYRKYLLFKKFCVENKRSVCII
jgi:hypothetical protein